MGRKKVDPRYRRTAFSVSWSQDTLSRVYNLLADNPKANMSELTEGLVIKGMFYRSKELELERKAREA